MANLNKELKKIFLTTLKRKAEEASRPKTSPTYCGGMVPPVGHRPTTYQPNLFTSERKDCIGCIYFYEWSDITRTPKTYYTLDAFEKFLNDCCIYLASWQREILSHMRHPYVSCKKGERDIIIKSTYVELKNAIEEGSKANTVPFIQPKPSDGIPHFMSPMTEREPYNVAITRAPSARHMQPMFEESEGGWFG